MDPYHLERFIAAQAAVLDQVRRELRVGEKRSHWMWYIFPQLAGLGRSGMAQKFAIASREEAEAYLSHPALGPTLRELVGIVNEVEGRSIEQIFGYPDHLKFHSSVTLFAEVGADNAVFLAALQKYFSGKPERRTLELLK